MLKHYKLLFSTTKSFQVRLDHAKRLNITPSLVEKIQLYKMTEEVLWADLDRYLHEDVKYLSLYLFLSISMLKMEL